MGGSTEIMDFQQIKFLERALAQLIILQPIMG
jgi:hypothetical protein